MDKTLKIISMSRRIQRAKKLHPYPIYHTEKSGWFTVVDDNTKPTGKRKIRKATEEKLWNELVNVYIDNKSKITLLQVFPAWIESKETPRNGENIKRLKAEWKAYYEQEPISSEIISKPLSSITSLELREWAEKLLKKHYPVDKKKFSRIFTIVNQCFEYAADEDRGIITENTWQKARKKINRDLVVANSLPSDDEQVFTDEERRQIAKLVYEDLEKYQNHPTSAGLQILFLFETGLRIGECCGLKFSDIKDNRLYIRRQATNSGVKEWTKTTNGYRDIPLTQNALKILEDVKAFNEEHGYNAEWIFQSGNADYDFRLGFNAADRKLRKLCKRINTPVKSPHKCRKTCLSTLLDCTDINKRTVQRFAGHRDISTTLSFYSFERKTREEQAKAIDSALKI